MDLEPPEYEPHNKKMDQIKRQIFKKKTSDEQEEF